MTSGSLLSLALVDQGENPGVFHFSHKLLGPIGNEN